jgi:transposase InsO family protein
VIQEVMRLKALMPDAGCRTIADVFNRRFAHRYESVGKTFVGELVRKHGHAIWLMRRKIKHARPRLIPINAVWGVDLTGKADGAGGLHLLLGVVEHGSRACLALQRMSERSSLGLLVELVRVMRRYGLPRAIRTDNEGIFTSAAFRFGLWLLGVRHQRTDPHCPWQNGRVERFFGTLKGKLDHWSVAGPQKLDAAIHLFRFWYNQVRPHQNLEGATPAEAWSGRPCRGRARWFEAWDGMLAGYYYASA